MAPISIFEWIFAQQEGDGLQRILALVKSEREANHSTKAWITLATDEQIKEQWDAVQAASETELLTLHAVPFAVKDNIDVVGFPTTAGCPSFSKGPVAQDAPIIQRLKAVGAIVIGKTNMDQFATGMMGNRSSYGTVPNALNADYISGGSSSGSAVVVSRGVVPFSLGSDTAGSCRVPAGLNNIVGLKPTNGAISARSVVPACRTLDCISIFTQGASDAETILQIIGEFDIEDPYSRPRPFALAMPPTELSPGFGSGLATSSASLRVAICSEPEWYGDDIQASAYSSALTKAKNLEWEVTPVSFKTLYALGGLLYQGPWVAERYTALKDFLETAAEGDVNPIIRDILMKSKDLTASQAFEAEYQRQQLSRIIQTEFKDFDIIMVPTIPCLPSIQAATEDPVSLNFKLGLYSTFVNFLSWSAITVPAGMRSDGLPFSVTLISAPWQEPGLVSLANEWLTSEDRLLGATGIYSGKQR